MAFGDDMVDGYPDGEEPLVYHYQKDSFRRHESKQYADLASGQSLPKRGFFKVLVGTRSNRFMLVILLLTFAMMLFFRYFGAGANERVVNGVKCQVSAYSYGGEVLVQLKLATGLKGKVSAKDGVPRTVVAEFSSVDSQGTVINTATASQDYQHDDGSKEILMTFTDYDIKSILCTVTSGSEEQQLKCRVTGK